MAVVLVVAGCAAPSGGGGGGTGARSCGASAGPAIDEAFTIGTAVIVSHPSLQLIRDGFADYLQEKGIKATYLDENAQGDQNNSATIAATFHENSDIDLMLAISTPIAQAVVQVEKTRPVLFAGITDPVAAGLVPSLDQPSGTNVTGTSDLNPNGKPVGLIQEMVPDVATVGVLYTSSEQNSVIQVETYKEEAASLGITIKESAITNSSELATGVQALAGVDAILIPTDNNVVAGIATVIGFGEQNQIPVFTADTESVGKGTVAARGVSYYDMGCRTGEMAYRVLAEGTDVATIPTLVVQETEISANPAAAARMGLTIPQAILDQATLVDEPA